MLTGILKVVDLEVHYVTHWQMVQEEPFANMFRN